MKDHNFGRLIWNTFAISLILLHCTADTSHATTEIKRQAPQSFADRPGCSRPPPLPNIFQFINGSNHENVELNDTQNTFFEVGTVITPVCQDFEQQSLVVGSTENVCQIWGQWSGDQPQCENVDERFEINGDFESKEAQHDGSITVIYSSSTMSSLTTFVEVLCCVSSGSPKLMAPQVDRSDTSRVKPTNRRGDSVGRAKGLRFEPPVTADSGTFGCRTIDKGTKMDRHLTINFQESSPFVLLCPNNITVATELDRADAHVHWDQPTVPSSRYVLTSNYESGSVFPIGSTDVHYSVNMDNDPMLTCEFKVTVVDEEKPSFITCPDDVSTSTLPGQSTANVSWTTPDVWDNAGALSINRVGNNGEPEGEFPIGKTDVVYISTDSSGNTAFCNFSVIVYDDESPSITNCPGNITINVTDMYLEDIPVTWTEPNITDNSGQYGINSSSIPGDLFEFGVTLVSYVVKDVSGNAEYCDFYVIVNDDVPPWFMDCPNDITHYTGDLYGSVVKWAEPRAADNVDVVTPVQRSHSSGDYFPEGIHVIQNIVRDTSGNEGLCEFNITVETAFCPGESFNVTSMYSTTETLSVLLTVERTPISKTTSSVERCSVYTTNAGLPLATRECQINVTLHVATWQSPKLQSCGETRDTVDIEQLSKISVVEYNVEEVAMATADATNNATTLAEENIGSVAETLENIVDVRSTSFQVTDSVVQTIDNVLRGVNLEGNDKDIAVSSSSILKSLQKQVLSIAKDMGNFKATQPRIAVRTVEVKPQEEIANDISFVSFRDEINEDENGFLTVNQIETVIDEEDLQDVDTSITLPLEIRKLVADSNPKSSVHFSFILFQSDRLFRSERTNNDTNVTTSGRVISATVQGPPITNLRDPVVIEFSPHQAWNESTGRAECVFWNFTLQNGVGDWATDGCQYAGVNDGRIVCHCYHLTSFAVLMDMSGKPITGITGLILDLITQVGCVLSIAGLVLSLATLLALRSLRSSRSRQILIQLCFSLLFLYVIFLGGVEATGDNTVCLIIAALLHYFTLSTLAWMAVEARNMYLLLVRVFKGTESRFMMKASIFAWGTPTIIVTVCVALQFDEYHSQYHCFIRPGYSLYYGLMLPIGLILLHNFVTFGLVVKSLLPSGIGAKSIMRDREGKMKQIMSRLQNALVMSVLLGLTWTFGFLAIDDATFLFQLLFCIFNSLQGFMIFILFCLRSHDVRKAWKTYMPFECNIHGDSYKVRESSYGYHLRGSDAHAWHGPMSLGPEDGQGLEYYMYTNKDRPTSSGRDSRYTFTSQLSSNSHRFTFTSQLSTNSRRTSRTSLFHSNGYSGQ